MTRYRYLTVLLVLGAVFVGGQWFGSIARAAAEKTQDILAAQVRTQGVACDKAISARRDAKRSRPDHEVWILKCNNATYRVSRYPDMGAKVEQLH